VECNAMAEKSADKARQDEIRKMISEEASSDATVRRPKDIGASSTAADSEADNGLERVEESLRGAEEQGRVVRPKKKADDIPVFDRGDLPPKI